MRDDSDGCDGPSGGGSIIVATVAAVAERIGLI